MGAVPLVTSACPAKHGTAVAVVGAAFLTMAHTPGLHYAYGRSWWPSSTPVSTSRAGLGGVGSLSTGVMLLGAYFSGRLQQALGAGRVVALGAALSASGPARGGGDGPLAPLQLRRPRRLGPQHELPPCPVAVAVAFAGSERAAPRRASRRRGAAPAPYASARVAGARRRRGLAGGLHGPRRVDAGLRRGRRGARTGACDARPAKPKPKATETPALAAASGGSAASSSSTPSAGRCPLCIWSRTRETWATARPRP